MTFARFVDPHVYCEYIQIYETIRQPQFHGQYDFCSESRSNINIAHLSDELCIGRSLDTV